jgi:hypothetical protein
MNNSYHLPLPSIKTLVISTLTAILLSLVIFWVIVLPAEYGLDPTGFGKKTGLLQLASSPQPAVKPAVISCPTATDNTSTPTWSDSVVITVPAQSGLEYKFFLNKNAKLEYQWKTDGAKLYYDFHGEPKGDTSGYFKSFQEDTRQQASGELIAPFAGKHGWYWENKTGHPVTVYLKTRGDYKVLGLM